VQCGTVEFSS